MERDSLALFISMLSFIFSVFYFLSFYAFRNSNIFKYDNQYVYLSRDNTFLCDDVKDKNTCKQPFYSNNMLNLRFCLMWYHIPEGGLCELSGF